MLTDGDFYDLWGNQKMSAAATAMIYNNYRGAKFYLTQTEASSQRPGGEGAGARFARELREVVEAHGGGDEEMQKFYATHGGKEARW